MERTNNTIKAEVLKAQDEVFSSACMFFDEFPEDIWFPAMWDILEDYKKTRYASWADAVHDEKVEIFVELLTMLRKIQPFFERVSTLQINNAIPDISPTMPAA